MTSQVLKDAENHSPDTCSRGSDIDGDGDGDDDDDDDDDDADEHAQAQTNPNPLLLSAATLHISAIFFQTNTE